MIVTKRLMLKNYSDPAHLETMVRWLSDPENVKFSEQRHEHHTKYTQSHYITSFPFPGDGFREIWFGDQLVGTITAHIDAPNNIAYVGILIGKEHWGQGFGTEAWSGFCDHLFANGIRKIEAGAMKTNTAMINIFLKTDMDYEGSRHDHFMVDGQLVDLVHYGRFA